MLPLKSGKNNFCICMAIFDVVFLLRVWNLSRGRVKMHWNPFGNAEQWIMVLVEPESNKTMSILLDRQLPMVLQVTTGHDNSFCFSGANTCCIGIEALLDLIGGNKIVSRWWHSIILEPYQWWLQRLGKNCFSQSWAGVLTQVLLGSQFSAKYPLRSVSGAPGGSSNQLSMDHSKSKCYY